MQMMLNSQQLAFVRSDVYSSRVIGNPGCGKTRSIIEYVLDKHQRKLVKASTGFLIITFSKMAQLDFLAKGKTSSKPQLFTNVNIRTVHSLALYMYKKLFNSTSISINTIVLATYRALLDEVDMAQFTILKNCNFIVVDEAQDISQTQYHFVQLVADKLKIPMILVGDPNQNIYQFQGGSDTYLMNHSNTSHSLLANYRSTHEIVEFLNHLRPHEDQPNMYAANGTSGPKPVIFNGKEDEIRQYIVDTIKTSGYAYHDIAIIGPVRYCKYNGAAFGLSLATQTMADNDIPFANHYKDGNGEHTSSSSIQRKEGHVNVLTCHGSKGLEFRLTICVNFHLNTFNRVPTLSDYNRFKYLWYVGLSRASERLIICTMANKIPFPDMCKVPGSLYETEGRPMKLLHPDEVKFAAEDAKLQFSITDVVRDYEYFNETRLLDFQEMQVHEYQDEPMDGHAISGLRASAMPCDDDSEMLPLLENDQYCTLYGKYMERLFMYYYYQSNENVPACVELLKSFIQSIVFLEKKKYVKAYASLKRSGIIASNGFCNLNVPEEKLTQEQQQLIDFCQKQVDTTYAHVYLEHPAIEFIKSDILALCDGLDHAEDPETLLFSIIVYLYQLECEKKYILSFDFTEHIQRLSLYFDSVKTVTSTYDNLTFEKSVRHPNIHLNGQMDAFDELTGQIIELKFTNDIGLLHELQAVLYYNCIYPDWSNKEPVLILNLKSGIRRKITLTSNSNPWDFDVFLCDVLKTKMSNNVFVLDIETNAVNEYGDPFIPYNTEIIDRYVYEFNLKHAVSDGLIRNNYPITNSHIHGIIEKDMTQGCDTLPILQAQMKALFEVCFKPIFIAHNGPKFDFPVMRYHNSLNGDCDYLDSMPLIKHLTNSKVSTNKLIDQYNYIFKTSHQQLHRAKDDVHLIVDIMNHFKLSVADFKDLVLN